MRGGVLWEKKLDLKPKYSWLSSDTSTYVEEFEAKSLGTSYRMKSRFIDSNKIGMWVYKAKTGEKTNIFFGTYVGDIDIKMSAYGVEALDGDWLIFSNDFYEKYKEPITNFFYLFSEKTPVRKIYYYEYPKDISEEEYRKIQSEIVKTL